MEYFLELADIPKKVKKKLHGENGLLHSQLPNMLKIKEKNLKNKEMESYLKKLDYLGFSFVRHPFER